MIRVRLTCCQRLANLSWRTIRGEVVEPDDVCVEDGDAIEVLGHALLQLDGRQHALRQEAVEGALRLQNFGFDFGNFLHNFFGKSLKEICNNNDQ